MHSIKLKVLNLSKNELTDKSAQNICKIIYHCSSLKGLFLHFNKFLGKGGYDICNEIKINRNIEVFDISFNNIGTPVSKDEKMILKLKDQYATGWSDCFK